MEHLTAAQSHDVSEHYIALLLSLLGVIQGLALNHLAEKVKVFGVKGDGVSLGSAVADSSGGSLSVNSSKYDISLIATYLMCFFIIVRVFQTYSSAAFEPSQQKFSIVDLSSIFAIGLLQYWIFDAIGQLPIGSVKVLQRVVFLALGAAILHAISGVNIIGINYVQHPIEASEIYRNADQDLIANLNLQIIDVLVAIAIGGIAWYAGWKKQSDMACLVSTITIAVLLVGNIAVSLNRTSLL